MITYNMQEQAHKVEIAGEIEGQHISWMYDPEHDELHLGQRVDSHDWSYEDLMRVTIPRNKLRDLQAYIAKELRKDALPTTTTQSWYL